MRLTPEVRVMLRPRRAFAEPHPDNGRWLYWRRPILLLFILCSAISLLTTGRFSLHVTGSTAIYWSLLPLIEIAGLAAVERRWPEARTVDRFFMGFGPWLLFFVAFAAYGSSGAIALATPRAFTFWEAAAAVVLVWSGWIDYGFFASVRKLLVHRAVSWTLFGAIFAGSDLWMLVSRGLGL
jgi:hypothetical protein